MKRAISLLIAVLLLCCLFPISSLAVTHWRQYYSEDEIRALIPKYLKAELKNEYGLKYDISKTEYSITDVRGSDKDSTWNVSGTLKMYYSDGKYATTGRFHCLIMAMYDSVIASTFISLNKK